MEPGGGGSLPQYSYLTTLGKKERTRAAERTAVLHACQAEPHEKQHDRSCPWIMPPSQTHRGERQT